MDSGRCIKQQWKCDGENDCEDNYDELRCPTHSPKCKESEFQCQLNFQCVDGSWVCDGEQDCQDGSDEKKCGKCCTGSAFCRERLEALLYLGIPC